MSHHLPNPAHVMDVAAITIIVGAWLQVLPALAALFAAVWYGVQIWESDTIRQWTGRHDTTAEMAAKVVKTAVELVDCVNETAAEIKGEAGKGK